jgi:hypothetical protein
MLFSVLELGGLPLQHFPWNVAERKQVTVLILELYSFLKYYPVHSPEH